MKHLLFLEDIQPNYAQVYPSKSDPSDIMDQFLKLINLKDSENGRLLVKCYVVSILIPGISKAMLMIHGPKEGEKTAFQDLVKLLLDPSSLSNLTLPRTTRTAITTTNAQLSNLL